MNIRRSTLQDLPVIMELFEAGKQIMRSDGNFNQWTGGYPQKEIAVNDINRGNSYIIEDKEGVPVATFAFIPGIEPTYCRIDGGSWLDDSAPYATIHRLSGTPDSRGIAYTCFSWCLTKCRNLRIDTHKDNKIMQHVITKFGFKYCGIIYLANGDERLAYQLVEK